MSCKHVGAIVFKTTFCRQENTWFIKVKTFTSRAADKNRQVAGACVRGKILSATRSPPAQILSRFALDLSAWLNWQQAYILTKWRLNVRTRLKIRMYSSTGITSLVRSKNDNALKLFSNNKRWIYMLIMPIEYSLLCINKIELLQTCFDSG